MQFISASQNTWNAVADGQTPGANTLLTLAQWASIRNEWPAGAPVAVLLDNTVEVTDLADDLPRIAAVLLNFPKWTDGRAYSQAHMLRSRCRYDGDVRAIGEVVVDMVPLLHRTGFTSAQLADGQRVEVAERLLNQIPHHYQGDVHEPRPLFARVSA